MFAFASVFIYFLTYRIKKSNLFKMQHTITLNRTMKILVDSTNMQTMPNLHV